MINKKTTIFKLLTVIMVAVFLFIPLPEINGHTYDIGVANIHQDFNCLNRIPVHIDYYCKDFNCNY